MFLLVFPCFFRWRKQIARVCSRKRLRKLTLFCVHNLHNRNNIRHYQNKHYIVNCKIYIFAKSKNNRRKMSKTVFITGANKGIGFGIAKYLGLSGWRVILGARNNQRANDAIAKLKALNIDVAGWVKVELSDLDSIKSAANELNEKYPDLTLLVNNAGIPGNMAHKSWETEIKDIKETLDVNYIGTYALTKALLPLLQKNEGRIANITVPSEISPYWHPLAYVASKAAQNALTGIMAIEFQQNNIPVEIFTVHPGPTTTDLNGNMSLPGFHNIDTVGEKFAELINDGKSHQGEFIELYPIVEE